jgi:serine/threonine protein kinase
VLNVTLKHAVPALQDPRGFIAKLSDFGLSMKMAAHDGHVPGIKYGTVQYLAPEVLNTHIMTKKADVFSFGIIMWEVWHSRLFAEFYNIEKKKRKAYTPVLSPLQLLLSLLFDVLPTTLRWCLWSCSALWWLHQCAACLATLGTCS